MSDDPVNSSDEATEWKQELRRQVVEAAIDRHDDDLSLVRAVAINDAYPVIAAAVRAEAVAAERRRIGGLLRQVDQDAAIQGNWSMGKYAKAVRDVRDLLVEEGTDG